MIPFEKRVKHWLLKLYFFLFFLKKCDMSHVIAYFHNNFQKASKKQSRNYVHNTWLCKLFNFSIYSIELSHFNFYIFNITIKM